MKNTLTDLDNLIQRYIDSMVEVRQQVLDTEAAFKIAEAARVLAEADRALAEKTRAENENTRIENERIRQEERQKMVQATEHCEEATENCEAATDRAEELFLTEDQLKNTLDKQTELYRQMQEMKVGMSAFPLMWVSQYEIPKSVGGSSSTWLCDYFYINTSVVAVAIVGGSCNDGANCGAASLDVYYAADVADWYFGASLSCEQPSGA